MKSVMETIRERQSVRSFLDKEIKKEDLKNLAEAAVLAPNAMNLQQWHFSVVSDPDMIQRMSEANRAGMKQSGVKFLEDLAGKEGYHAFYHAPAAILITGKPDKFTDMNCAFAAENIVLAAQEMGIDSCVIASTEFMLKQEPALRRELSIPEEYEHVLSVALGYRAEEPKERERKTNVVSYV